MSSGWYRAAQNTYVQGLKPSAGEDPAIFQHEAIGAVETVGFEAFLLLLNYRNCSRGKQQCLAQLAM